MFGASRPIAELAGDEWQAAGIQRQSVADLFAPPPLLTGRRSGVGWW
jgi:hypothetical protein